MSAWSAWMSAFRVELCLLDLLARLYVVCHFTHPLHALHPTTEQLPQVCEDALLAVATLRAANGPPLTIEVFGAGGVVTSGGWRERCIAAVELMRDSVGRSPHNEVVLC